MQHPLVHFLLDYIGGDDRDKWWELVSSWETTCHTCTESSKQLKFISPIEVSVVTSKVDFCLYDCTTWAQNGFSGEQDMVWETDIKTWHIFDVLH